MTEPPYQDLRGAQMPVVNDDGAELRIFSGTIRGVTGPALNHVPVTMVEIRLAAILFGGQSIGEPVAQRGPFVMNTMSEIVQAYEDYQAGRF